MRPIQWTETQKRAIGALQFAGMMAWVAAVVAGAVALVTSGMAPGEAVSTIHEAIEQAGAK